MKALNASAGGRSSADDWEGGSLFEIYIYSQPIDYDNPYWWLIHGNTEFYSSETEAFKIEKKKKTTSDYKVFFSCSILVRCFPTHTATLL